MDADNFQDPGTPVAKRIKSTADADPTPRLQNIIGSIGSAEHHYAAQPEPRRSPGAFSASSTSKTHTSVASEAPSEGWGFPPIQLGQGPGHRRNRGSSRSSSPTKRQREGASDVQWQPFTSIHSTPEGIHKLYRRLHNMYLNLAKYVPQSELDFIRLFSGTWFDDTQRAIITKEDPFIDPQLDTELYQRQMKLPGTCPPPATIDRILRWTAELPVRRADEAGWNDKVHSRLLEAVFQHPDGTPRSAVDYTVCTSASPHLAFIPPRHASHKVDFCMFLEPALLGSGTGVGDASNILHAIEQAENKHAYSINHTSVAELRRRPISISIETKKLDGNVNEGVTQLGVWLAAQWRCLAEYCERRTGDTSMLNELPFLPGILVIGPTWRMVYSVRDPHTSRITVWQFQDFGDTTTALGVYKIVFTLRELAKWSLDIYWPWFKRCVLEV